MVNTSGNAYNLIYSDQATGISATTVSKNHNESTYDLQGRRVKKTDKGIYVINGKKTIR